MEFQHKADGSLRAPADDQPRAEFDRALAHKFGNLLQVVTGNLELLAARIDDERLRGYLANAQSAARQLSDIAHALVEASEAEAS